MGRLTCPQKRKGGNEIWLEGRSDKLSNNSSYRNSSDKGKGTYVQGTMNEETLIRRENEGEGEDALFIAVRIPPTVDLSDTSQRLSQRKIENFSGRSEFIIVGPASFQR